MSHAAIASEFVRTEFIMQNKPNKGFEFSRDFHFPKPVPTLLIWVGVFSLVDMWVCFVFCI